MPAEIPGAGRKRIAQGPDDKPQRVDLRARADHLPDRHRMLPASTDAEQGVICSLLLAFKDIGAMCREERCTQLWFHSPALGTIYGVLMDAWDDNDPIDVVTLTQRLHDKGILEQVGGAAFISSLFTFLPTATNAEYYLTILKEKACARGIIQVATEFASRAYEEQETIWELQDEFEREVLKIAAGAEKKRLTTAKEAVMQAMEIIQTSYENRGAITGLSTGFYELDKLTDGMHKAEMIVIAARPSQGKTALAMNIADHLAVNLHKAVAVFSLEMSTVQLVQRMICSRASIDMARIRDGFLADRDFPALTAAASQIAGANIQFDDSSDLTIQELRGRARRLKNDFNIEAIFVDYLQLIRSSSKKSQDNRQLEVAEVSAGLKATAKELDIPVIVLAQISRDFEKRGPQARPRLSDLRESGAIEQDADVIAFLVRAEMYAETDEEREELRGQADLIIAKQRSGPVGDVALTFLKEFTRFEPRATTDGGGDYQVEEVQPQQQFQL